MCNSENPQDTPAQRFMKRTTYVEACQKLNGLLLALESLDAKKLRVLRGKFSEYHVACELQIDERQERLF